MNTEFCIFSLIFLGILHESFIYWLQYKFFFYTRLFGSQAFLIHNIQLGSSWLLIGIVILILLSKLTCSYKYHYTTSWSIVGFFVVTIGLAIMWFGFKKLGWARMMKIRLFVQPEATWIHAGIFKYCRDPMYRGSQLSMFGLSLLLDSLVILVYVAEMVLLQQFLILLERKPVPTALVDYLTLKSINPQT